MQPHEERVVIEKKELDEKLNKLEIFITKSGIFQTLPYEDKELLDNQYIIMQKYSQVLEKRIKRFQVNDQTSSSSSQHQRL